MSAHDYWEKTIACMDLFWLFNTLPRLVKVVV